MMKRALALAPVMSMALILASPAVGDIIYDNGGHNDVGVPSDLDELGAVTDIELPLVLADDFAFANSVLLQDVHWWGSYWLPDGGGVSPDGDDFRLEFYTTDGLAADAPAIDPFLSLSIGDTGRTDTGDVDALGNTIYEYWYDLDDPVILPALTTFYVSIANNTTDSEAIWAWSASVGLADADGSLGQFGYFLRNDPDIPWAGTVVPGNLAFNLTGTVIPEPATLSLFGIGLGSLAIRRRFSKRAIRT